MKIFRSVWLVLLLGYAMIAQARPPEPIAAFENIKIETSRPLTLNQAGKLIAEAGRRQGWSAAPDEGSGSVVLSKTWGRHTIVSVVKYTNSSYSVLYKDSIEMDYAIRDGVPSMHPYYNKYVKALTESIRVQAFKY